jgi:L-cystine transport system substrate-binding protein
MKKICISLVFVLALFLTACGSSGKGNESPGTSEEVRTINIVGAPSCIPFVYADEDGVLQGYEIEVLKAVDELLPQYEFNYDVLDYSAMAQALESGNVQIAVSMLVKNPERLGKVIFPEEYSALAPMFGLILEGRTDIQTYDDLAGKKLLSSGTGYEHSVALQYNEAHPDNPILFEFYTEAAADELITKILGGQADTTFLYKQSFEYVVNDLGVTGLDITPPLFIEATYFMIAKEETKLRDDIDGALRELKNSGKLAALSTEFLGEDVFEEYTAQYNEQEPIS